jgi:putative oxygen-independent coproporphyrinogen III oxidase
VTGKGPAPSGPVALYVHFPFCLSICPYCDFVVVAGRSARGEGSQVARLVEALAAEIELRAADRPLAGQPLRSVYFGGGTPSLMSPDQLGRLLAVVERAFGIATDAEVTLEVNPGSSERGDLAGFRAAGANRLSIGAQSMDEQELRRIGRRHSFADVTATVREARRAGFDNVSLDLLYDLPGQTLESWQATLEAVLEMAPEHLSAYALTLDDPDAENLTGPTGDHLPLRPGARRWRDRAALQQDEDRAADMYLLADELLAAAGLGWYEISNWARPGFESRHNLVYWLGGAWEAVGPGAHAFDGERTRRWNSAQLGGYMAALEGHRPPPGSSETSDQATVRAELAILRLRTSRGLAADDQPPFTAAIAWGVATKLLECTADGSLRLSPRGRLLSNELMRRFVVHDAAA